MKAESLLASNPKLFFKMLAGEIKAKAIWQLPESPIQKEINGVLFEFDFDYDPAIKRMYFNLYELETVDVIKKVLKRGDTFIDVGANIGYLSRAFSLINTNVEIDLTRLEETTNVMFVCRK